jgi:hypothetical protein
MSFLARRSGVDASGPGRCTVQAVISPDGDIAQTLLDVRPGTTDDNVSPGQTRLKDSLAWLAGCEHGKPSAS